MSDAPKPLGSIAGFDLTVPDADGIRDFYSSVVGWSPEPLDMGGYADYMMRSPETGEPLAGICHARGLNADLPPQWLVYITVANLEASLARCVSLGGAQVTPIQGDPGADHSYCVIKDPAGAILALMQAPRSEAAVDADPAP